MSVQRQIQPQIINLCNVHYHKYKSYSLFEVLQRFSRTRTESDPGGGGGGGLRGLKPPPPSKLMRCVTHILTKILASFN